MRAITRGFAYILIPATMALAGTGGRRLAAAEDPRAAASGEAPREAAGEAPPLPTDLVERAGITLLLLDVEAVDRERRPLRGLTKEDFTVRLNFLRWPIYSVDNLCDCAEGESCGGTLSPPGKPAAPPASTAAGAAIASPVTHPATNGAPPAERRRFVLFFDFSQLQMDGRREAVAEAKRWIRETMQPEDLVLLAAYASLKGLKRLTPFTSDRAILLAAIDQAYEDRAFMETFAFEIDSRMEECRAFRTHCYSLGIQEYWHGRHSMKALETFMTGLGREPGTKRLILFSENGVMFPDDLYGGADVPDHFSGLEELAAAATGSQTVVYAASVGEGRVGSAIRPEALVLTDNLADFTGGGYNRRRIDLARLTDGAGRGCRCIYRIGLVPPNSPRRDVLQAKVTARGVVLDYRYRVRFLAAPERWMREAQAVLADPESARDIDVSAAILPESADTKSWDVSIDVSFDTRSLAFIPDAGGSVGSYEVGALLQSANGSRPVELLDAARVRATGEDVPGGPVVHTMMISGLKPGDYRLTAFVRDRVLNVFGGAEARLSLPRPKKGGAAGPVLFLGPSERTVLPLRRMRDDRTGEPPAEQQDAGIAPLGSGHLRPGERLSSLTWICPGKKKTAPAPVLRFLAQEGKPLYRFEPSPPTEAGACLRYGDVLDTAEVAPDAYAYHILWTPEGESASRDASAVFEIVGRDSP